jgi:hypothetical protein
MKTINILVTIVLEIVFTCLVNANTILIQKPEIVV